MIRRAALVLCLLVAALAPAANAAIVTVLNSGSAQVGVLVNAVDFSILNTDFRAGATFGIVDTTGPSVLSLVFATDAGAPAPNNIYALLNGSFTELGFLIFDTTSAAIVGTTFHVNATFSGGPFTDPGLAALVGQHVATFQLFQAAPLSETTILGVYNFESLLKVEAPAAVPEPGTFLLLGCGVGALAIFRRRLA